MDYPVEKALTEYLSEKELGQVRRILNDEYILDESSFLSDFLDFRKQQLKDRENDKIKATDQLIEKAIASLIPKMKKSFINQYLSAKFFYEKVGELSIEDYATKIPFVGIDNRNKKNKGACQLKFFCHKKKKELSSYETSEHFREFWKEDKWFLHLLEMQKQASKLEKFNNEPIFSTLHTSSITYCALIKFYIDQIELCDGNEEIKKVAKYQIYVGKQGNTDRWGRSGVNHFAQVRNILAKRSGDFSVCDSLVTYFGPSNVMIFTIGCSDDEKTFSTKFPNCRDSEIKSAEQFEEFLDLTTDPISLSPKTGDKGKKN